MRVCVRTTTSVTDRRYSGKLRNFGYFDTRSKVLKNVGLSS